MSPKSYTGILIISLWLAFRATKCMNKIIVGKSDAHAHLEKVLQSSVEQQKRLLSTLPNSFQKFLAFITSYPRGNGSSRKTSTLKDLTTVPENGSRVLRSIAGLLWYSRCAELNAMEMENAFLDLGRWHFTS